MMQAKSLLPPSWEIPDRFRERLGDEVGRQRTMFHDGHLLIVLHRPPLPDQVERAGEFFWRAPDGQWRSTGKSGTRGLRELLSEYEQFLDECESAEEVAVNPRDYFDLLERLAPIQRSVSNLYSVLQEARKTVSEDRNLINIRDEGYKLSRTAELAYTLAKNGLEFSMAKKAEEQAESAHQMSVAAHRLNILAGFFFPLVTIASIMGMQLLPVPQENATAVFVGLILIGLVSGTVLTFFVSGRSVRPQPAFPKRDASPGK